MSSESRKKKGNGGMRIFQRSLKEMCHGDKQPNVQLSHDKSFRNLSKNEMEELSGNKHEQTDVTLNKEKIPQEKICQTNLHTCGEMDMECKVFQQKTPARFNHLSVEYDSRKISNNSFENNNYYSNSYKRSCERNSDCPKFSQSIYRIKSKSSHNQSYMGPQNQSHHSHDQSSVHSRGSHVCTFNHSHVTHSNSGSDSCLVDQARNAPGGHRVFQHDFYRNVKGSQDYDFRHQRQYSHSHKEMYNNKNENLRYNGAPHNFHNSQIQVRNNYDYSQNNSNMNQNANCVPRHTKSEDWSSELLNISDWNNNNVREEHIEEVLKKEWTDNVINKKESFVSAQSLATQKLIETKENILSECNSFEENKQTYENKATEKNSEVNLLEKCRGESETAVLIHCQTDIVNYEIEQWLPAENLGEREINPVIENKDEGKCAVKEILNCSTGKEDIETNGILNFNESEKENICLSKTNECRSKENKVECEQLVSNIKLNAESMVRENSVLNFEDTGIGLDQWTDEISLPNDKYMLNTSTVQTDQHYCAERTNKYDLLETEHELSQTENTIVYAKHEPVDTENVETESVVIECEHELIATDHEVEIVEKECQLNETEGSINKTEYELIDTDHEHDETEQKLSSNVNEDTSKQRVVVTKVIRQENKCKIFYVDGEAIIDQMESNVEENSYEGSVHLEREKILHAEECKMEDENQSDKSKFGDRNNTDPSMPGECHTVLNQEHLNELPEVIEDTECNKCAMDIHLSVQRKDECADTQKKALMLEKKDGIVVENHCPVESNSDCIVEAQTVLDDDSDISTHGVLYDDLIKEKMKDVENEITSKLGSKTNTNQKSDPLYDFLAFPDFENRGRSKSLPGSPYMQIVELMQQFKHNERERNILLEKQKKWQSHTSSVDLEHTRQFPAKSIPVIGRGKVTVSLSPYDKSPVSSYSQSVSQPEEEDWETDLIPLDQYFISENLDKNFTDDRAYDEILDSKHECKSVKMQAHKVPVSYPYMKLENDQAQQTLQCNQKPFISKGRGCLSPEFRTNLSQFLNVCESEIPFHHKKGFAIQNYNNPKIVEKIENMDLHASKKQQEVSYISPENWENTFNDIDSLELTSPKKCTPECQEDLLMREVKEVLDDKVQEKQNEDIKSSNHEEQVIFKKPQTIENENFEPIECYIRNDSSSMSSLPQCELLTSPKSQSTLSGVPTMSDYENSDIDTGPLDIEKNDFQDDIFNQNCLESLKINSSEEKRYENKYSKRNHNTGQFLVNETVYDTSEKYKPLMEHGHESELGNDFTKDDIDHHFMSYYYPDLSSCCCHSSVQQYWVWHTCMCQVPRLCEIRTCQDYWLQNPFGDMDGIYQTMPIPDVNNNRKREPVNKKSWSPNNGPVQNKQDWSSRRGFTPPGFPCRPPVQVIPPPMPFSNGMIPPPNPHQSWERMFQRGPAGSQCRMNYRGPKPKEKDIPVHLVDHNSQQSCKTVVSPFVCAKGFYWNMSPSNIVINTVNKNKNRHQSETDNVEQNDSGVVVEGSPRFIGPIMPQNVSRSSKKSVSPMSAIRELLNEGKSNPVKKLVDYPYSETDESEDDRSRSSVAEKRQREETESMNVTDDSNSESENSKRPRSNVLGEVDIKHFKDVKKLQFNEIDYLRKFIIPNEMEKKDSEILDSDESEDGSSRFYDCSSTLSNYQMLQTVLNKKFPKKQSRTSSKVDVENDMLDLTDDGSEIISVASQESSDQKVKPTSENKNNGYPPFWASSNSGNDSPGCGYPAMFPPYMYPGWVSPKMISAKYGSPSPETEVLGYQRRRSTPLDVPSRRSSTPLDVPSRRSSTPLDVPSRRSSTSLDVSPRKMTINPDQPCISPSGNKTVASQSEDSIEERFKRGNLSIRGMDARLRFHRNSKLLENQTTFQTRIAMLQNSKQTETDSDSQSSLTFSWKVRFLNKCRSYKGSYIDSHCHLDFLFNRSGFGGTWTKFKKNNADTMPYNFEGCVAVFCHPSSFRQDGLWSEIAEEEDVWLTFGCHPKNATEYTERTEINLKMCLLNSKVVALGEIGLDYSGIFVKHKEVQQIVFRKQIQIALDMNKPLVIHCREAEEDALTILDEMVPKNYKIHCHCFTGTYESAKKWMDMFPNLFIGLTPLVTYRTATSTHEVARFIPLERLLLETDAPYFVPRKCPRPEVQHSHPGLAITVAEEVAWLKKCPIQEVLYSCRQNTRLMYGI